MNNKIILGIIIFVVIVVIIYVSTNSSSESYKSKANKCKNVVCSFGKKCVNGNCVNYEKYVNEPFEPTELMGDYTTAQATTKLLNTKLSKINTNYPNKVILAQKVLYVNGLPSTDSIGAVKFAGVSYTTPKFIYYPMFIFTATKPWVTLNSNGARVTIRGGLGSDLADISIVLVPWGNVYTNLPDPTSAPGFKNKTILGIQKIVPIVTDVLAVQPEPSVNDHVAVRELSGRGTSGTCSGFSNIKVKVVIGKKYAIAMQATICTDDYVYMEWDAFSTTIPAVKFLDSICDGVVCSDNTFKCNYINGLCDIKKCDGVVCSSTQKCEDITGQCVNCWTDKCDLSKQDCIDATGECVNRCPGKCDLSNQKCIDTTGECINCWADKCLNTQKCIDTTGECVDKCDGVVCIDNTFKCNNINGLCDIKKCDGVVCSSTQKCEDTTGQCINNCWAGKCSNTQKCIDTTGECVDKCDGVVCIDNTFECNNIDGMCIKKCDGVVCLSTQNCEDTTGECINNCWTDKCSNTQKCIDTTGECVDKCDGVVCSSTQKCKSTTGLCVDKCEEVVCSEDTFCYTMSGECVNIKLKGNNDTANTQTGQRNTKLTKTNTNYPDKVIIAQGVISNTTGPITNSSNAVRFSGVTYTTPKFIYYPMFIFTAVDQWVTLNSNGARIIVQGGTGSDSSDISVVLVPWGNVTSNLPDPPSASGFKNKTILGIQKSVPIVTDVLAVQPEPSANDHVAVRELNGRGTSKTCSGFSNIRAKVVIGKTYAIAMQGTICTDDYVYMEWDAFSTIIPAVTFSEN